jgi:hypothetical protein
MAYSIIMSAIYVIIDSYLHTGSDKQLSTEELNTVHRTHIRQSDTQSTQSAGPVRFLIFCSISIFLLASLVAGRGPQCSAGPP